MGMGSGTRGLYLQPPAPYYPPPPSILPAGIIAARRAAAIVVCLVECARQACVLDASRTKKEEKNALFIQGRVTLRYAGHGAFSIQPE